MRLLIIGLAPLLGACNTLGYYAQSVGGQWSVLARARPIDSVLDDAATPPELHAKLAQAVAMRRFASRVLGLPNNASYTRYTDLKRDYVLWNVFAAPELSVKPIEWCFLVVGCVAYRGYFHRDQAERFAAALRAKGDDVYVAGVAAYSTLGWFSDPLLSTVIDYPDDALAGLIFHELAHQEVFAKGDTAFNESFATTVATEGVRRWLIARGAAGRYGAYLADEGQEQAVIALILSYRPRLARRYASALDNAHKRTAKRDLFSELNAAYHAMSRDWPAPRRFDRLFATPWNNARLVQFDAYYQWVPAFRALLAEDQGNLPRFYASVRKLAQRDAASRHRALTALTSPRKNKKRVKPCSK